ncbi:MAG TPA: choice-of-anchor Q domain-containing protein [Nitrolancea sp.]
MRPGFLRRFGGVFSILTLLLSSLLGLNSSVALAAPLWINVPCNTDSLVSAINSANVDGGTLILAAHCTYTVTTPATATDGLPVITGNVTIKGQAATITRDSAAPAFRIFQVASGGTLNVDFLTISQGSTTGLGGAILLGGTASVSNSTISDNTAGNGGGISVSAGANLTATTTTFSTNNSTGVGGGGIIVLGSALVTRSTFSGNTAAINGGSINIQSSGLLTVISSTVANNSSGGLGGGISNLGTVALTNLTFSGNTSSDGDAVATGNSNVTISNSILDDESDRNECSPAGTIKGGFNLVSDDSCVTSATSNVISASHPLSLGPLQFNGGQTQTMLPSENSTGVIDRIPVANCVAADASNPGATIAVTTDQTGINRPQGSRCDIGAAEVAKDIVLFPALTTVIYDAQRHNISSRGLVVTAYNIAPLDQPWDGTNGNMQRQFTYTSRMGGGGGYQLVVVMRLPRGDYALSYEVQGDPAVYIIKFTVR